MSKSKFKIIKSEKRESHLERYLGKLWFAGWRAGFIAASKITAAEGERLKSLSEHLQKVAEKTVKYNQF